MPFVLTQSECLVIEKLETHYSWGMPATPTPKADRRMRDASRCIVACVILIVKDARLWSVLCRRRRRIIKHGGICSRLCAMLILCRPLALALCILFSRRKFMFKSDCVHVACAAEREQAQEAFLRLWCRLPPHNIKAINIITHACVNVLSIRQRGCTMCGLQITHAALYVCICMRNKCRNKRFPPRHENDYAATDFADAI